MTFWVFLCHGEITQVNDMKEVFAQFNNADHKTLAIFDVDMVLVQPSDPAFQMANIKRFSAISKRIMKEIPADKQMLFLSLMTVSSDPVLIDDRIPQFLQQIIQRGIPAMGLTANLTGQFGKISKMEHWRIEGLRQLGFVDDREDNLKSLETAIQKLDKQIEYHGFHYIGAQNYPSKAISEEEFESRWQELATKAKELN